MACAFPQLDEGRCVSEELLAGRCERRAALVADEQRPAQPLFERTHAGADGCLADVKLLSRAHEALRPDDGEKRSCELDVHCRPVSKNYAAKYRLYSFVSRDGTSTIPPGKGKPAIVGSLKLHRSRLSSPPCFKDEMESHCAEHQPLGAVAFHLILEARRRRKSTAMQFQRADYCRLPFAGRYCRRTVT